MTKTRTWIVSAADRTCSGSATSTVAAWRNATTAALQLACDTTGVVPLRIHVEGDDEPAEIHPARTESGGLDIEATSALLNRLLHLTLEGETDQPRPR